MCEKSLRKSIFSFVKKKRFAGIRSPLNHVTLCANVLRSRDPPSAFEVRYIHTLAEDYEFEERY